MTEREDSIRLANAVMDKPHIDPDGDICVIARQFLREIERRDALVQALDSRCLFSNPDFLEKIAGEIDCDGSCDHAWREWDTGASGCHLSDKGEYCPNDLAETLRDIAKLARNVIK